MTIKQQGGVFGRNPTFNDVDAENLTAASAAVSGNLTAGALGVGTAAIEGNAIVEAAGVDVRLYNSAAATNGDSTALIRAYKSTGYWNDLRLSGSAIVFDTYTGERARITNDGLTFNGDTAAANALDDYEEGVWTPNYTAATGGDLGGTQNRQGYYTKVGNKVTVQFYLYINTIDVTGKSGDVTVTGLPFTGSLGGNATGSLVVTEDTGQYGAFTNSPRTMKLSGSGDSLVLLKEISSNVEQPLQVTDFATGGGNRNIIRASFTYIV